MKTRLYLVAILAFAVTGIITRTAIAVENPQSGSFGIQGRISSPPPTQAPTIAIPRDGQAFTEMPVTVGGLCQNDLLVKIFKNNVFAGSFQCKNSSYTLQVDLFVGTNQLVARQYDTFDQASPDSNLVNVTFNTNQFVVGSRVSMTSIYAKRGANPGQTLTWPVALTGGEGPYAISVDWGDGKALDLKSLQFAGTFDIEHIYDNPGVYNILIKATDRNGISAFLQVVGLANGPAKQSNAEDDQQKTITRTRILWQPAAVAIPLIISSFWLGRRYEKKIIRQKIERGEHPF